MSDDLLEFPFFALFEIFCERETGKGMGDMREGGMED